MLAEASAGSSGMQRLRLIATFLLFEAAWLACVMGAARGQLGWGILLPALIYLAQCMDPLRR